MKSSGNGLEEKFLTVPPVRVVVQYQERSVLEQDVTVDGEYQDLSDVIHHAHPSQTEARPVTVIMSHPRSNGEGNGMEMSLGRTLERVQAFGFRLASQLEVGAVISRADEEWRRTLFRAIEMVREYHQPKSLRRPAQSIVIPCCGSSVKSRDKQLTPLLEIFRFQRGVKRHLISLKEEDPVRVCWMMPLVPMRINN